MIRSRGESGLAEAQSRGTQATPGAQKSARSVCRCNFNRAGFRCRHHPLRSRPRPAAGDHRRAATPSGATQEATQAHAASYSSQDLPEADRFNRLLPERKHFIDTITMISYRAETSMVGILREKMACTHDARTLLRQISDTECERTIKSYVIYAISSTKLRRFSRTPNSGFSSKLAQSDSSGSGGQKTHLDAFYEAPLSSRRQPRHSRQRGPCSHHHCALPAERCASAVPCRRAKDIGSSISAPDTCLDTWQNRNSLLYTVSTCVAKEKIAMPSEKRSRNLALSFSILILTTALIRTPTAAQVTTDAKRPGFTNQASPGHDFKAGSR